MPMVVIENIVSFAPNNGVMVARDAIYLEPEKLHELIALAFTHINDQILIDACCGSGVDLLPRSGDVSFDDYLIAKAKYRTRTATLAAKRKYTSARRREFQSARPQVVLAMIEIGIPYVCNDENCGEVEDLTVDHKTPLSRGGSDDISNLQFLCRSHNSSKGDQISEASPAGGCE